MKKISKEVYLELQKLIKEYEFLSLVDAVEEPPYFTTVKIEYETHYNPKYGDDRICNCGHPYYRHFDSYDNNEPVGCKYCECFEFTEASPEHLKYLVNVGLEVFKKTGKPFKSTFRLNRIKGVILHPKLNVPAYTFYQDNSYVECEMCEVVPDKL